MGGKLRSRSELVTVTGSRRVQRAHACATSEAICPGHSMMPAWTSATASSATSMAVTTPKPPPPPRRAQNRSSSWDASTRRSSPSEVTTSIASTW